MPRGYSYDDDGPSRFDYEDGQDHGICMVCKCSLKRQVAVPFQTKDGKRGDACTSCAHKDDVYEDDIFAL